MLLIQPSTLVPNSLLPLFFIPNHPLSVFGIKGMGGMGGMGGSGGIMPGNMGIKPPKFFFLLIVFSPFIIGDKYLRNAMLHIFGVKFSMLPGMLLISKPVSLITNSRRPGILKTFETLPLVRSGITANSSDRIV